MDLIVRGHQVVDDGYEFFASLKLVTLWSAPNYREQSDNGGAVMTIDESLLVSFQVCVYEMFLPGKMESLMMHHILRFSNPTSGRPRSL